MRTPFALTSALARRTGGGPVPVIITEMSKGFYESSNRQRFMVWPGISTPEPYRCRVEKDTGRVRPVAPRTVHQRLSVCMSNRSIGRTRPAGPTSFAPFGGRKGADRGGRGRIGGEVGRRNRKTQTKRRSRFRRLGAGCVAEAPPGFEPGNNGFAIRCLTTWLRRL